AYDSMGHLSQRTAQDGRSTRFAYDQLGNLRSVTDALNQVTTYGYADGLCQCPLAGSMTAVQKANGKSWAFGYDFDRQIDAATDPLGNTRNFSFDQRRLLQSLSDENGSATQYEYDALQRQTHRVYSDGTEERFAYDANGNLLTASNGNVTLTRTYDN